MITAREIVELMTMMRDYVVMGKEEEWLTTALPAFGGRTPLELIQTDQIKVLIEEFHRLQDGEPV